jgi:hypothetical protein
MPARYIRGALTVLSKIAHVCQKALAENHRPF